MELLDAINNAESFIDDYQQCFLPDGYYTPGYLVILAAILKSEGVRGPSFDCAPNVSGYLQGIGFSQALWGVDEYEYTRRNQGVNYSLLTLLETEEQTDQATTQINGCLRQMVPDSDGLSSFCHVVGELHDNVWSHGRSTGFSLAQKRAVPNTGRSDHYLEFALADRGIGFKREMNRSGHSIDTDANAIDWCIQEGNSTKHGDDEDEWAQSVPDDLIGGGPFGSNVQTRHNSNHHQGLGLYHLVELVKNHSGELTLVSGNGCFSLNENGDNTVEELESYWKGVAISCKLKESKLLESQNDVPEEIQSIMASLSTRG